MDVTFRPLPAWPYSEQEARAATYKAAYSRTLDLLEREISALDGREVIIGVVTTPDQIRLDGRMRADAKVGHHGVEVSFELPDRRRLTFHTDRHKGYANSWQDNLRAVALGLEALRAVNRYGITETGQQYAGFVALGAGASLLDTGRDLVARFGSLAKALRATHPDTREPGLTDRDFQAVMAFRETQREAVLG